MGCFDSVVVVCPECETEIQFQSKAGECSMLNYSIDEVPVEIALDLHKKTVRCDKCFTALTLKYKKRKVVRMRLIKSD